MKSNKLLKGDDQPIQVMRRQVGKDSWSVELVPETIPLIIGDRILFRKNDKTMGVVNGDFATITQIDKTQLTVTLDDNQEKRKISFNTHDYNEFTHGYAATVHKAQGITKDEVYVYAGGQGWNRHLAYVALSRHKDCVNLYVDRENFNYYKQLERQFARNGISDELLDWPLAYGTRRGFDAESLLSRVLNKLPVFKHIKDRWQVAYGAIENKNTIEINYLDKRFDDEWENFRHINDTTVQRMIASRDSALQKKDPAITKRANRREYVNRSV